MRVVRKVGGLAWLAALLAAATLSLAAWTVSLTTQVATLTASATAAAVKAAREKEWLQENPGGTFSEYACIQADLSAEIVDEVLAELPEETGLSADWLNQQQRALCEEEAPDSAHATAGRL